MKSWSPVLPKWIAIARKDTEIGTVVKHHMGHPTLKGFSSQFLRTLTISDLLVPLVAGRFDTGNLGEFTKLSKTF